jgi:hypothetical protein
MGWDDGARRRHPSRAVLTRAWAWACWWQVRERHTEELLTMAKGVYELRKKLDRQGQTIDSPTHEMIHRYLDCFYMKVSEADRGGQARPRADLCVERWQRIALRILIGHYLALHSEPRPDYVGIVCMKTKVKHVIEVRPTREREGTRPPPRLTPGLLAAGGPGRCELDLPAAIRERTQGQS